MKRYILMTGIVLALGSTAALAQPDIEAAVAGQAATGVVNALAPAPLTPDQKQTQEREEMMKKAQEEGMAIMKLPPDQMRARIKQMEEMALRAQLNQLGFKDKTLQDQIVAFIAEQEKSRDAVRIAGAKVQAALRTQGAATTDQGLTALLEDYLGAVDDAIDDREDASAKLDALVGWSRNPRLRAFLSLNGFIGEGAWLTGDVMMSGMMAMGSLGQLGPAPK